MRVKFVAPRAEVGLVMTLCLRSSSAAVRVTYGWRRSSRTPKAGKVASWGWFEQLEEISFATASCKKRRNNQNKV